MVWFTLALFAVSFLLTALLAPKPEFENARAEDLDPENFPRATENAPIPLLFGCAKIKGPNTLWYGNYEAIPITKKVKTGLFSSTRVVTGHEYKLSIDLGLCLGPASIKEVFIDSVPVSSGIVSDFDEDFAYFSDASDGIEDSRGPPFETATTVPFDVDFDASATDSSPTIYNLSDLGLTEELVDGGGLTLLARYVAEAGASVSATSTTVRIDVEFFDAPNAGGSEFTGSEISDSDTVSAPVGIFGSPVTLEVQGLMPSGTRSIRISANAQITIPANLTVAAYNHLLTISGLNVTASEQNFDINEPELFGGRESGGGWVGNIQYYPGNFTQPQDPHIQASVGTNDIPAYRGTAHLVMINNNIGERPALSRMEFLMARYSDLLSNGQSGRAFDGSEDMNPAEVIYLAIVDGWSGLDIDPTKLNLASFQTASATLLAEQHGASGVISSSKQGKDVIRELLRQIDGVLAENSAGEVELVLIRDDYDVGTLPIYDQSDISSISSFSMTAWEDVVTEVKVSFSDRTKDSSRIALAQNDATLDMIGTRRTAEVSFPFCYDAALANQLAARELSRLSIPLVKLSVVMNRTGYDLTVGDVIKITYPLFGLDELVCRVQKVDSGSLTDNRISVELIQDIFAVSTTVFAVPENTGWVDNRPEPVTVPTFQIVETPYFFASRLASPVEDGNGTVIPFPVRPQTQSTGFSLNSGVATGDLPYFDPESVDYPFTGTLASAYATYTGFATGRDSVGFTLTGDFSGLAAPSESDIRDGIAGLVYANGEWMSFQGLTDNMDGTWTFSDVDRAILGTRPLTHAVNSTFYFLSNDLLGFGDLGGELLEDGTLYFKLLDEVGGTKRAAVSEAEQTFVLSDIADRPLRPRNLQADASRDVLVVTGTHTFTWLSANRTTEEIAFEQDSAGTPDITETYDVEVWVNGIEQVALASSGVSSGHMIDLSGLDGGLGEVRVYSRRTSGDLKSSVYYAVFPFVVGGTADSTAGTADTTTITADTTT